MRWSFWPVSITVHVAIGIAVLIAPLMADVEPPVPAPMHSLIVPTKTVPIPPEVVASVPSVRSPRIVPNVIAPLTLERERETPDPPVGPLIPDLPQGSASVDLSMIGSVIGTGPVAPVPTPVEKPAQTLFRPGQGVREPKRIAGSPPEYPMIARNAHVRGVVILEAVINERGEVGRIKVLKSAPLLDAAAIAAVQQWRYTPTLLNGVPVSVLMTITINFTLQD